jgi:hydroxyacylglutathione hydrolase
MSELDVRSFTVGPVQENCYIVRPRVGAAGGREAGAVIIDPGDEAGRLLAAARSLEIDLQAILITHCHFDHIGAVAPLAHATGAPVYCPRLEQAVLADIMSWVPPGFGPFESYDAEHTLAGGEHLSLAGMDIDVLFTPGHSPGHLTYAISPCAQAPDGEARLPDGRAPDGESACDRPTESELFSGDVLFAGSVGRVDLPGGDWVTLERSIEQLLRSFPAHTRVNPGHMGATTLGRERDANPFLAEIRSAAKVMARPDAAAS